ncbi:hypothetical protein [Rhodococcus rhodochrous]|uniref:Uncharacterized protein n=1 Tax=Rhodococcus rhodochrous TaxID=1829 RepID=A0AA46X2J0_RHORH|nr:hypothetical protein [Rhodococcus rhodochrous]UZF48287.1 hypothetical protein KUM34_028490 [Rhodococcus rhodochrous]
MPRSGPNPVLAPIRRWVLYSRTNLTISTVGVVAVLSLAGMLFGENPQTHAADETPAAATGTPAVPSSAANVTSYELDEVTESELAAATAAQVAASAPATAMAYAHTFVDTNLSDTQWTTALGRYTVSEPGQNAVAARPRTPVVITGPTVSTPVAGPTGTQRARVVVPTQAGEIMVAVVVEKRSDGGQRWVVDTPLPTLDLSDGEDRAPQTTSPAAPRTPTEPTTPPPTVTPAPAATSERVSDPTGPERQPTPSRRVDPAPVPVLGPIPIPDLDTPIPGQL